MRISDWSADVCSSDLSNVLGFGEMGIGNTSAAAALMSVLCGLPLETCGGRGAGHDDEGRTRKLAAIQKAIEQHACDGDEEWKRVVPGKSGARRVHSGGRRILKKKKKDKKIKET